MFAAVLRLAADFAAGHADYYERGHRSERLPTILWRMSFAGSEWRVLREWHDLRAERGSRQVPCAFNLLPLIDSAASWCVPLVDVGARGILLRRDGSPPILLELESHACQLPIKLHSHAAWLGAGAVYGGSYDALTQPR